METASSQVGLPLPLLPLLRRAAGLLAAALLVGPLGAAAAPPAPAPGGALAVAAPELVIPGRWLTDRGDRFLLIPLTKPARIKLQNVKIMTDGGSILVVVSTVPDEKPITKALQKYKLVIEALKAETGHDEGRLKDKLQTWLDTEDDEEVRVHIDSALASLKQVSAAKKDGARRTLSVPLGLPSFLARGASHGHIERALSSASARSATAWEATRSTGHVNIVRESFSIEVPYPVPADSVFVLSTNDETLVVAMPLERHSLAASGISTGGKPFSRAPVFDLGGHQLAGPPAYLSSMAGGLDLSSVGRLQSLQTLKA